MKGGNMKKSKKNATTATGGQPKGMKPVTGSTSAHQSGVSRSQAKAVNR